MEEVTNKYVTIQNHIEGMPKDSDFVIRSTALSLSVVPGSGYIIVKNLVVSIDPYQLNRMKIYSPSHNMSSFGARINPGEEIEAYGVARVVSGNQEFEKGDLVIGVITWGEYSKIHTGGMIRKFDQLDLPLSHHVGVLGFSGLSAYGGLFGICKPKKGDKVFVSAASGSIGSLVGQYAKLSGCYVVGCAGSNAKVKLLKEKLGFDEAFNYKEETNLKSSLKRYFPDGIDIYYDNVGGEMQDAAIENMNCYGRVAVCGVISEYTDPGKRAAVDMVQVVYKRIKIQGFLGADYMNLYPEFLSKTIEYISTGRLQVLEDISHGLENIPAAFIAVFRGDNIGKKLVQIAEE